MNYFEFLMSLSLDQKHALLTHLYDEYKMACFCTNAEKVGALYEQYKETEHLISLMV